MGIDMERWSGRVALVTGASSGIGAAIARCLVTKGMKVVGVARNIDKIKTMAAELSNHPGSLTAIKCDITKDDQVLNLFSEIQKQFGGVDVCINNAGISYNHTLLEGTPEEWRTMLDVNVVGLSLCTREAVASMRQRGIDDGHIIHINSLSGHRVSKNTPILHFYSATKHAVTALTKGLQQELHAIKSHIRVTAISPGIVETEFVPRMLNDKEKGQEIYRSLESLTAEDIAASVVHALGAPTRVQIHDIQLGPAEQIS
ncbi:hypothetical protein Pcinc_010521 [Petrolisthes cinctipes]|uniref:Dehydrogenase/reductase SDR family member 11 n=1 Tax=Petrolisthes cinctipes TaxID=88211 RepID=A0AAE1KVB4_PETCI|nr:hypothetical protein Pcinc_010521 [Petrolisthes cinctipes]